MSAKLPTISVTADKHSYSESSDDDSCSNDMDYNHNSGGATDVEDFDSQTDAEKPRSRTNSCNTLKLSTKSPKENDVTDVEDYNDSDSDEEEKSKIYPELKMSLQEFLQNGLQEQAFVNNEINEKIEIKAGDFLQAQNLNTIPDYLTDCEDYNTDSEIEYEYEKSVCVDFDAAVDDQGRVHIADASGLERSNDESDEYEDVSVVSDISDLASALSDITCAGVHGMSEDELLEVSGDEEVCQISCSESFSENDQESICEFGQNANLPAIDVTFIGLNGQLRRNSTAASTSNIKNFLETISNADDALTEIEKLDDSISDDGSFDSEEDNKQPIPQAVIIRPEEDGGVQTDNEEVIFDDSLSSTAHEVRTVSVDVLPLTHREVTILKEDLKGDTITTVMPMDNEFQFGIYNNIKEECQTDSEEYSCTDEREQTSALQLDEILTSNNIIEGDVTVANEVYKPPLNKRAELHSNAESVTDVEEIYVAGTNRRKKLKARSMSKGKNKFLDIEKLEKESATDVEDMELSDLERPSTIKFNIAGQMTKITTEKVTDIEDLYADEVSDVSDVDFPVIDANNSNLKDYFVNSNNVVITLELDATKKFTDDAKIKIQTLKSTYTKPLCQNQNNTDVEDIQLTSDMEDIIGDIGENNCTCSSSLNDMLNESYTVVHDKSVNSFNADAEKLHIKGMPESRDAHTDVEYVESDESAARGDN